MRKRLIIIFLIPFFVINFNVNAQNTINRNSKALPFTVFKTTDKSLTIDAVLEKNETFKPAKYFTKKTRPSDLYWIKIDFGKERNKIQQDSVYYLRFRNIGYISMYTNENGIITENKVGRFEKFFKNKSIIYTAGIAFKKTSLINNRYIYLKIRRVIYFENVENWRFNYKNKIQEDLTNYYYSRKNLKILIPVYIFTGICLVMFILTFAFYLYSRRKEFLFYTIFVLFLFLYLSADILQLHSFFFGESYYTSYAFFQIAQVVINLFYILFVMFYLNTKVKYKILHKALKTITITLVTIIVLDALFFATGFFIGHIYLLDFERIIMTLFGLIGMMYLLIKGKDKLAYFVVIGSFLYMIGALGLLFYGNRLYMILGSGLEILIFASGLTYKTQLEHKEKIRFEKESATNKAKALRAQINPHFIFNSLSSIQHLITGNDKKASLKYLSKFSRLTRNILESSIDTNVVLNDEIKMLQDYLELESLRFDESFKHEIVVDKNIDLNTVEVPFLILQPFVENAIIHGLLNKKDDDKQLKISFSKQNDTVICTIDDNGIGREASSNMKESIHKIKKKSRGLEVTIERLNMLNETNAENSIKIIDKISDNGTPDGTTIIITIPV